MRASCAPSAEAASCDEWRDQDQLRSSFGFSATLRAARSAPVVHLTSRSARAAVSGPRLPRTAPELACAPSKTSSAHANRAVATDLPLGHPIPAKLRNALRAADEGLPAMVSSPPNPGALSVLSYPCPRSAAASAAERMAAWIALWCSKERGPRPTRGPLRAWNAGQIALALALMWPPWLACARHGYLLGSSACRRGRATPEHPRS